MSIPTTNTTASTIPVQNTDMLINDISQKTNSLNLIDSTTSRTNNGYPVHMVTHSNYKLTSNYNRKSQNQMSTSNTTRHYQQPISYSSYLNSIPLLQSNQTIPLVSHPQQQPFIYTQPNYTPNIYTRTNSNYVNTNNQKRIYNPSKLWPNTLKKQNNKNESINEIDKKDLKNNINEDNAKSSSSSSPSTTTTTTTAIDLTKLKTESVAQNNKNDPTENFTNKRIDENKFLPDNKTPMCIINELVRYNKITHEYVLLDERGPAHKKVFYIMLKLGTGTENEEKYEAQGSSIKKTQHAAAELALKSTKFKLPVKRDKNLSKLNNELTDNQSSLMNNANNKAKEAEQRRLGRKKSNRKINPPTVLLNTLAMKLGLVANYTHKVMNYTNSLDYNLDLSQPQHKLFLNSTYDYPAYTSFINTEYQPFNQMHRSHQSYQIAQQIQRPKLIVNVKLTFADKEFKGQGITLQQAKHDAASKALEFFKTPEHFLEAKALSISNQNKTIKAYRPPQFYKQENEQNNTQQDQVIETNIPNKNETKSEIQLVYEYSNHLKKSVKFELIQESGPSHIKKFVTKCLFGENDLDKPSDKVIATIESTAFPIETLGEGNSKKLSKKNSAVKMLVILKEKFEPLLILSTNTKSTIRTGVEANKQTDKTLDGEVKQNRNEQSSKKHRKSKGNNIDKIKKTSPEYGKGSINPISRLIQIQQAKKEKEPVFELVPQTKKRNQEFVMQVTIEKSSLNSSEPLIKCEGKGSTKKLAKQKAAEAMLIKLGYQSKQPIQSVLKPSIKLSPQNSEDQNSESNINTTNESTSDSGKDVENKSEKKVKFVEDPNLKAEDSSTSGKLKPIRHVNPEERKKALQVAKIQSQNLNKQQKFKQIQQIIANNNQLKLAKGEMDPKHLDTVYKIASELLESVNSKNSFNSDREFYSETAEKISKAKQIKDDQQSHQPTESSLESEEKKIQFKILNGGVDIVNYKRMLEYLADTLGFKVNYQSLLGRDGSVYSYVSLSILPETDKPLNGHGSTHIESSNAAALCALQYLSSKLNIINNSNASITTNNKKSINLTKIYTNN